MTLPWRLAQLAEQYRETSPNELERALPHSFLVVRELAQSREQAPRLSAVEELEQAEAEPSTTLVFALTNDGETSAGRPPGSIYLGRGPDSDLRLEHPSISNAQLSFEGDLEAGTLRVTDLGSRHGSKLNGVALAKGRPQPLSSIDVIELAKQLRAIVVSSRTLHRTLQKCENEAGAVRTTSKIGRRQGLLERKVAIITGGGRGLGRAYAVRFAREGCHVVVNDVGAEANGIGRDARVSEEVVAQIEKEGGTALASAHDITKADEVEALLAAATTRFGCVDILVCSAGAMHAGSSLLTSSDDAWQRLLNVNLLGAFRCVQGVARHMVATQRPGRILTTSSLIAVQGAAGLVEYAASKAAVIGMSKTAALELAPHDITVNVLTPMAWTRLTEGIPTIAAIPNVEQVLSPEYVADVALFLVSELAAGISGYVIDVGGPHLSFHRAEQGPPRMPQGARWTPEELHRRWASLIAALD
jgi:NAD(P)-dependent dehydrogenase (short-subunit alcohol dehydrogenase family)